MICMVNSRLKTLNADVLVFVVRCKIKPSVSFANTYLSVHGQKSKKIKQLNTRPEVPIAPTKK